MRCAYLALILLLALAVCADAAKKRQPKRVCKRTKYGKKKCRPKPAPRPSPPLKPLPPSIPAPKPGQPSKPVKCSQEQKEMNKWLQAALEKRIKEVRKSHRPMYFCGLWRVVELAQDYKTVGGIEILRGIEIIKHKSKLVSQQRQKYVDEFELFHQKKILQYKPLKMGKVDLLPFGCKWEINQTTGKEVSCLFVTSGFVHFIMELARPDGPLLTQLPILLPMLQDV